MKVYYSRHGLVQCPTCGDHFRVGGDPADAQWLSGISCPLCDTRVGSKRMANPLAKLRNMGRSGVIAAALFGMAATAPLAGCEDEKEQAEEKVEPEPTEPDPAPVAEYGAPPMPQPTEDPDASQAEPTPADDNIGVPEYGEPAIPATDEAGKDDEAGADKKTDEKTPDKNPDEAVPDEDSTESGKLQPVESDEPASVARYGLAPMPEDLDLLQ